MLRLSFPTLRNELCGPLLTYEYRILIGVGWFGQLALGARTPRSLKNLVKPRSPLYKLYFWPFLPLQLFSNLLLCPSSVLFHTTPMRIFLIFTPVPKKEDTVQIFAFLFANFVKNNVRLSYNWNKIHTFLISQFNNSTMKYFSPVEAWL